MTAHGPTPIVRPCRTPARTTSIETGAPSGGPASSRARFPLLATPADLASGGETFARGGSDVQTDAGVPRDGGGMTALRIFESRKPVIGAINGPAVGVGIMTSIGG